MTIPAFVPTPPAARVQLEAATRSPGILIVVRHAGDYVAWEARTSEGALLNADVRQGDALQHAVDIAAPAIRQLEKHLADDPRSGIAISGDKLFDALCDLPGLPGRVWQVQKHLRHIGVHAVTMADRVEAALREVAPTPVPGSDQPVRSAKRSGKHLPRLTVATDASRAQRMQGSLAGVAFVGSDGAAGARTVETGTITGAELAAALFAVQHYGTRPLHILTDSMATANAINEIVQGHEVTGKAHFRRRVDRGRLTFAQRMLHGKNVTAEWVPGHSGHRLNEAADRLAVWARRTHDAGVPKGVALRTVAGILAEEGLTAVKIRHSSGTDAAPADTPIFAA